MKKAFIVIFSVLLVDQLLKIWVKTHMYLGQSHFISGDWFIIHFAENKGMAFGMELFGEEYGKLFLSVFRIAAVCGLIWYLRSLIKSKAPGLAIVSISLVLAGAIGNIIDSAFYGLIFDKGTVIQGENYSGLAQFSSQGYASFLHGSVVDMLYFPIIKGHFPSWVPFLGNEYFIFFSPVFNISDSAITIGVALILLFQRRFFMSAPDETEEVKPEESQPQG